MDHGIDMLFVWRAAQHVNPRAHRDVGPTAVVAAWVSVTPWVLWLLTKRLPPKLQFGDSSFQETRFQTSVVSDVITLITPGNHPR